MSAQPVARVEWVSDITRLEIVLWERVDARLRERHELPLSFFQAPSRTQRVGDLAQAPRITIGGASKLVDRVEIAGLIARRPDRMTGAPRWSSASARRSSRCCEQVQAHPPEPA